MVWSLGFRGVGSRVQGFGFGLFREIGRSRNSFCRLGYRAYQGVRFRVQGLGLSSQGLQVGV